MDLVFDDQPLEGILYGGQPTGPTSASLFTITAPLVSSILQALRDGAIEEPLHRLGELVTLGDPVRTDDLCQIAKQILGLVPQVPCPIVEDRGVRYDALLEPIFAASLEHDQGDLVDAAGTTLYRFYEGAGRYAEGIRVLRAMLERAKGDLRDEAILRNNLGYEYGLSREWEPAEPCFVRAVELLTQADLTFDRNNSRLNLLVCQYERSQGQMGEGLEAEVSKLRDLLAPSWLQRKALILLARISERRGDRSAAAEFVRQAVEASKDVPSKHRLEDQAYLERLDAS